MVQSYRSKVYKRILLFWGIFAFLFACPVNGDHINKKDVTIGVLAKRGPERTLAKWGPTADYLTKNIEGYSFKIMPLGFEGIYSASKSNDVEFILSNSSFYVGLEMHHGVNRIVTLKNLVLKEGTTVYGGVIFCKVDRKDIASLDDLKDRSFMAVHEKSLGGWQAAWFELENKGIYPYKDFAEIKFGGTHDAIVYAVLEGKVDAGTVRTDTLERMQDEGKINLSDFRILNQYKDHTGFPYIRSTQLYPEWPLAKTRHTSDELAGQVSSALLRMPPDSKAAKAAKCFGWTIPLNYQPVHECLKTLRIGPYKDYGKVTLTEVFMKYWLYILLVILGVIALCIFSLYVIWLNQRLNKARIDLKKYSDNLERLVDERTEELRLERDKLNTILETMSDGVYIVNQNYDIEYVNSYIKAEFGPNEGLKCYPYLHGLNKACSWCKIPKVSEGKTIRWEFISPENGKTYDIIETPLNNIDGSISKLAILRDITERKHAEQEREKFVKTLEFKNKELRDIVYTASHDLKSPLVNIEGFSSELNFDCDQVIEMLAAQDEGEDKRQQIEALLKKSIPESLRFISASAKKMASLLNGLLQISRVGTVEIKSDRIDMNRKMTEILAAMEHQIKVNNITVTVETLADCVGDPNMLDHVFGNLIDNAIKYRDPTKESKVIITGNVEGAMSIYCVEDNGIGIASGHQRNVFEIFHRLNPEGSVSGEGLGLTIVTRIMNRLGGKIWLESEPGKGSKFFIALPTV